MQNITVDAPHHPIIHSKAQLQCPIHTHSLSFSAPPSSHQVQKRRRPERWWPDPWRQRTGFGKYAGKPLCLGDLVPVPHLSPSSDQLAKYWGSVVREGVRREGVWRGRVEREGVKMKRYVKNLVTEQKVVGWEHGCFSIMKRSVVKTLTKDVY